MGTIGGQNFFIITAKQYVFLVLTNTDYCQLNDVIIYVYH